MNRKEIASYSSSSFSWALLTLGASELILVLTRPLYFLIFTFVCACLFSSFIVYVLPGSNSIWKLSRSIITCFMILIVLKLLYSSTVLLEISGQIIVMNFLSLIVFLIGGFISGAIFSKLSDGTN